ncbi:MAG TPA: ATP-dependent Clp protease ATP-binding subunit [Candidatus Scybalousia intestinigallinarum]|nr:ATP-dependent Clp protease ATP-binding subunit [Candidatus Scybalousia intestinigallinarum]
MFSRFSEEAQKVLLNAKKEMQELKHPYVGTEHLLLSLISIQKDIGKKMAEYGVTYQKFKNKLIEVVGVGTEDNTWFLYTPLLKRVLETAILISKESGNGEVGCDQLLFSILEEGEGIAVRILEKLNVDIEELQEVFSVKLTAKKKGSKKKLMVEEYGLDLTKKALNHEIDPVIGREDELLRVMEILSRRTKNNPLLIGDAGVGKTAIVEALAQQIVLNQVPDKLKNKRLISVSIASLVAGTKYRGEFEERVTKMLKEIENDDTIILFIDEIHTLMGAGGAEGAIDAANIFKPALARGKLQLIGATTIDEYKQSIEKDKAIERRFQVVVVEEPQSDKVYDILVKLKPLYEKFHHVKISDEGLRFIIQLTDKYMHDRRQPDKAIDVLDEVCAKVSLVADKDSKILHKYQEKLTELVDKKNKYILQEDFEKAGALKTEEKELSSSINTIELRRMKARGIRRVKLEDIADVVSIKAKVPIYEIHSASLKFLRQLEKQLKQKIYGQDQAVMQLVNFTKKMQLGYKDGIHPTSFLFVGPTGVGKTMLAKEYSRLLFGEDRLIRLDMSEYREAGSITKIIGSAPGYVGYDDGKNKLEEIKNKPHAVILVDEIEKAHPSVLNLFLQILDEGRITDAKGNTVHLEHNIIIMTSNIGFSAGDLGFVSTTTVENKLQDFLSLELLNRIDQVIQFNRLTHEAIRQVVSIQMRELKEKFKAKEIKIQFTDSLVEEIIGASEYEKFGARRVSKIIEDKIDNYIIDQILLGMNSIKIEEINL